MRLVDESRLERVRDVNMKPIQSRLIDRADSDTYRRFAASNSWTIRSLVMRAFTSNDGMFSMIRLSSNLVNPPRAQAWRS